MHVMVCVQSNDREEVFRVVLHIPMCMNEHGGAIVIISNSTWGSIKWIRIFIYGREASDVLFSEPKVMGRL